MGTENEIMINTSRGYSFDGMNSKLSHFEFVGSIGNPDNVRKTLSVVFTWNKGEWLNIMEHPALLSLSIIFPSISMVYEYVVSKNM